MTRFLLLMVICTHTLNAQSDSVTDSPYVQNEIIHLAEIESFYNKLRALQQKQPSKINIVHIGDSHIQADLMTNATRKQLQNVLGNGGRGFVFPHSLAKTNGSSDVRFTSNISWESQRNIYPAGSMAVGLSGIGLETDRSDFAIEMKLTDSLRFNTIRLIMPENNGNFSVAVEKHKTSIQSEIPKNISHRIKKGDALSSIAVRYNVSVKEIKLANNLKSDAIRAGKMLKIPTSGKAKTIDSFQYIPLSMRTDSISHYYYSELPLNRIALVPSGSKPFNLNGIVLENDENGIVYHNIGVNGAKFSDFNKYPLFFDQLKSLTPDLMIVSLGTNESFDKLDAATFKNELQQFVQNIRSRYPNIDILVITPPPSLFNRRSENAFVKEYAEAILSAGPSNFAVYDLYSILGGHGGISANIKQGLLGSDRVHYTKDGYIAQGNLLADAIMKSLPNN
ncbi:MAG: LysM peptidoglycan-binding domain-containing protein [Flavobacterium sp.]|nr:LysM peptidoglycan-binding domain-containing protein [Flavobacterium sp.]